MLTSLDPQVLRARAWDHGARPIASGERRELPGMPASAIALHGLVFVPEDDVEPDTDDAADRLGLVDAGVAPLMARELDCAFAAAPCGGVERATDASGIDEVSELVVAAYDLRADPGLRRELPDLPGVDAWLLREGCHATAAVVTTVDADLIGIWSMATPPEHQRQGRGARLLRAVLGHYALEGATTACLLASPQGEPLYRALGFEALEHLRLWRRR